MMIFESYASHIQNQAVSSAIRSVHDDIYFERGFLKNYIKSDLVSNGFLLGIVRKKH